MGARYQLATSGDVDNVTAETDALKTRVGDLELDVTTLTAENVALRARVDDLEAAAVSPVPSP